MNRARVVARSLRGESGFTLVEMQIAVVAMLIVFVAFSLLSITLTKSGVNAVNRSKPVDSVRIAMLAIQHDVQMPNPLSQGFTASSFSFGSQTFYDGQTDTTSPGTSFVSAGAAFSQADVGKPITETDGMGAIPAGTTISAVSSPTHATLSQNALKTMAMVMFQLPSRTSGSAITWNYDAASSALNRTVGAGTATQLRHVVNNAQPGRAVFSYFAPTGLATANAACVTRVHVDLYVSGSSGSFQMSEYEDQMDVELTSVDPTHVLAMIQNGSLQCTS